MPLEVHSTTPELQLLQTYALEESQVYTSGLPDVVGLDPEGDATKGGPVVAAAPELEAAAAEDDVLAGLVMLADVEFDEGEGDAEGDVEFDDGMGEADVELENELGDVEFDVEFADEVGSG
ncbi:MAG: hypothetical protein Q9227_005316 [Pyrenula ochraceoflavens]